MKYLECLKFITEKYGPVSQIGMTMEECGELITSLNKYLRKYQVSDEEGDKFLYSVIEEMADVLVMIDQLKLIFKISDDQLISIKESKVNRQVNRIKSQEELGLLNDDRKRGIIFG